MTKPINTGGPAFPQSLVDNQGRIDKSYDFCDAGGMHLRDYFAAKAMQAQISIEGMEGCDKEQISAMSYEMADAMIDASAKGVA